MTRRVVLCLCLAFAWPAPSLAQAPQDSRSLPGGIVRHPEEGRPFVRNYRPFEVGGGNQNWAILQDRRGVLYIGSANGVLEFDGASWRLISTPKNNTVRSLGMDAAGRIYAGSVGDFGYLAPDSLGALRYVSLLDRVPSDAPVFGDIWRTLVTPQGVYFQADQAILRWANDTVTVIEPASRFYRAQMADGRVYVGTPEAGLNLVDGETLRPLPGTARLANEPFPVVLDYDDSRVLVGTRSDGLFLYDGSALTPFPTDLDALFTTSGLYRGTTLPDGTFAFASIPGGVGIVDRSGRRVMHLDRDTGLPSITVYYVTADRDGGLWLGHDSGITRVDIPSPASFFDQSDGFDSGPQELIRHAGRLYLATGSGVYYMEPGTGVGGRPRLQKVSGVDSQCWSFAEFPDVSPSTPPALVVGCTEGLFDIAGSTATPISTSRDGSFRPAVLRQSKVDPTRLWVGLFDGLTSFRRQGNRWRPEARVPDVGQEVRTLFENPDGSLWAGTQASGLLRVTFATAPRPGAPRPDATVKRFGPDEGMPGSVFVQAVLDTPYFYVDSADPGYLRFDAASQTFVRDTTFDAGGFDRLRPGIGLVTGLDGRVYVNNGKGTVVARRDAGGTWTLDRAAFGRFGATPMGPIYAERDGVVWFGGERGELVRFDTAAEAKSSPAVFTSLIRRVTAPHGRGLFGGADMTPPSARLEAAANALRFEFAAPTFIDESATEFQSRLEGLDTEWSAWTTEARRDFTNLGFGNYRFVVRARSATGQVGGDAVYAFTILPPWYRTWWAYAGYLLLAAMAVGAAAHLQRRRVVANERERARFAEAKLRAEAAEALARSESEGKKNVELLSEIGREITASLDIDTIFGKLYERVNQLADADVFGVGLYHPDRHEIEYRLAIEKGKRYAPYTRDTTNRDQLPVWCIERRAPIVINDFRAEYTKYVSAVHEDSRPLEDGSMSQEAQSIIYLPLIAKDRVLGIITIQSFETHAYTDHHVNVMQSLASYTAIALDNAAAYRQLNEHEHQIRRLFEEAERARAVAVEADAAKSAFLSTVSHELRTPLTSVLGFAKIIKKRLEERIFPLVRTDDRKVLQTIQQVEDNLKVVVSEGERLTKLIDDVLDLAKIEAGKLEWHMEPVTIADIVEHATAATSSLFDQKGLRLVKQLDTTLPAVSGDRDRLIQVVINLISNAVKFTDAGTVTCRAERRGSDIVVSVSDTGLGIAQADQAKVFERFKQVGDTLTDKPKGTGLGLPICKEIVEHHGGRIWVESAPGQGSTFSFTVPALAEYAGEAPGPRPIELAALIRQLREQVIVTTPRTAERQPRIMVVDDDPNIRELLLQELTEAGYKVSIAGNGREAVAEVRRDRPDLVVLDVMMPEMNGFDVAAVLKNDPQTMDIPIIILSIVQDRDRGFRLGVDRYLTKPIDTDLLFREVGSLIEQRKSHKRVLVVDEDASTVRTLTDVLTTRGYSVAEARGDDLIQRAVAVQPDIIMLNSITSARSDAVQMLRFEKGMENVLFFVYQ